jgi:DNA-directed RNA polymerase sigma subunit (sigma70/sigma32)
VHLDQQRLNELPDHREEVEEVMDPSVKLSQMLAGTNQEVRAILYARFGMESGKELTYEQLADQLRCSLWQAFRIVQRALEELRDIKKPPEDD